MRFEEVNTCAECGDCNDGKFCDPARKRLRSYTGIRFTSDSFDCALPVSIDSHTHCSFACLYCFSDNLSQHREQTRREIGQTGLQKIERLFAGEPSKTNDQFRLALKYNDKKNGYPCPVQLGAINDPCDNIERQQGWLLNFIPIAIKYNQPVRMSTKGILLQNKEYLTALEKAPHLFWVAFSIISANDDVMRKVDLKAPVPSERLKTMKMLSKIGVKTSLRLRPILPGISKDYKELIEKAAEAGAKAISYEVGFYPGTATEELRERWNKLSKISNVPFRPLYKRFGKSQACIRPPYTWTEEIMHRVKETASGMGMTVGVSDPAWKQLTDTGCCCGILPDDPVFGNWRRESATNQLFEAMKTGKLIGPNDILADWTDVSIDHLFYPGAGPLSAHKRRTITWKSKLKSQWNNLNSERGPLNYFQGALIPEKRMGEDIFYRYIGLKRRYPKSTPYWD